MRQQLGAAAAFSSAGGLSDIAGQDQMGWQRNSDAWPTTTTTTTTTTPTTAAAKARNNGKLKLAAIVHYDALDQLEDVSGSSKNNGGELACGNMRHEDVQTGANRADELGEPPERQLVAGGQNSHVERRPRRQDTAAKKSSSRLRRLFFTKNKRGQLADDLIDDTRDGQQLGSERLPRIAQGSNKAETGNNRKIDLELGGASVEQQHKSPTNDGGEPLNAPRRLASSQSPAQVIEFKFDLIVEGDRHSSPATLLDHEEPNLTDGATDNDEILRPIRQRKLLDHVNELVESFVLDSMDVCLLTAGRRRLRSRCDKLAASEQFDYLLKCAHLTLTYAFQLLEATGNATGGNRSPPPMGCSLMRTDTRSIELEATLFEQRADGLMELVDLVVGDDQREDKLANGLQQAGASFDCLQIGQALELLDSMRTKLNQRDRGDELVDSARNRVLMIRFKLKQQVNGGTFTNSMCLLDVSEPNSSSLSKIIESIFSGQALAHLKRQKLQLRALELQIGDTSTPGASNMFDTSGVNFAGAATIDNNKHYHQFASLERLIQAESLIYKQLSSALIKMLVIVHCHRLEGNNNSIACPVVKRLEAEHRLMDYNLGLLEFVNRIRRGSQMRLKRRKRHLKSHLARSNLSLISDTNLSLASSADRQPEAMAWPRAAEDLMITSPFRHRIDRLCQSSGCRQNQRRAHCYAYHIQHRHHHRHRERQTSSRRHHSTSRHQAKHRSSSLTRAGHWSHASELDLACDSSSPISIPSSSGRGNRYDRPFPAAFSLANHHNRPPAGLRASAQEATMRAANLLGDRNKRSLITESDPDESLASVGSASLMSYHSSSGRRPRAAHNIVMNDSRIRRHIQQQQLNPLESPSDSNTLDDSIEMQSFSSSSAGAQNQLMTSIKQWRDEPKLATATQQCDTASETCCSIKMAEPPRQLKLEEFLNRLSNFIGPNAARPLAPGESLDDTTPTPNLSSTTVEHEDEDDDCKSHSSILEHLSSLTLESNLKLVKQNQRQISSNDRVSVVHSGDNQGEKRGGHLQSLLKSTLQLQQRQTDDQKVDLSEQLRALTVDCSLEPKDATNKSQGEKTFLGAGGASFESSETPPTSMDSSGCVSSSCSSSTSSNSEASPCLRNKAVVSSDLIQSNRVGHHLNNGIVRAQIKSP